MKPGIDLAKSSSTGLVVVGSGGVHHVGGMAEMHCLLGYRALA